VPGSPRHDPVTLPSCARLDFHDTRGLLGRLGTLRGPDSRGSPVRAGAKNILRSAQIGPAGSVHGSTFLFPDFLKRKFEIFWILRVDR
jgi:hypothetical protein